MLNRFENVPEILKGRSGENFGTHICVQKSLMMKCIMNDEKPLWTLVLDKDIGSYCLTPLQRDATHIVRRPHPRRAGFGIDGMLHF